MSTAPDTLLTDLLRDVSRSFYLTLRILPRSIRPQIGLAYLLARTTDTIADTELVSVDNRLAALHALRERILGRSSTPLAFGELTPSQASEAERILLLRAEQGVVLLERMSPSDGELIRRALDTITTGQELDLRRFGAATAANPVALETEQELDHYTYCVAGCVGEFWTRICGAHLFPNALVDESGLLELGLRFGKGLQLVNILRDLPADLRKGRCYLPREELSALQLTPADLLHPSNEPRLRPVYDEYLDRAAGHLRAGWDYTNSIPRGCLRVRLACAWPLLIGMETLQLLRSRNFLDPDSPVKVTRSRVRQILVRSILLLPFPGPWRGMFPGFEEPS